MKYSASLLVIAAALLWGAQGVFVRLLTALGLAVYDVSSLRICAAATAILIFMICCRPRLLQVKIRELWIAAGAGVIAVTGLNCCYFNAIELTSLGVAAVLMYISPALVTLLSCLLFHEQFTRRKALALILALCGCSCVSGIFGSAQQVTTAGVLWGLGAGCCYAAYSIFSALALRRGWHPLTLIAWSFIFAAISTLPLGNPVAAVLQFSGEPLLWWDTAGIVLLCSLLPSWCYNRALQRMEAGRAAVLASIETAAAAVYGIVLFDDPPTLSLLAGIMLVLGSAAVLHLPSAQTRVK